MMVATREQIVSEAREWIGTPYRHQARAKGVAVDCVGLLIGVARRLGLVAPDFDVTGYTRRPDGWTLIEECERHMTRLERDFMRYGDGVIVRFDAEPQHFGFVAPYRHGGWSIIHATAKYGCVVETRLLFGRAPLAMKFVAAYRLPGIQ
jgi:cell wall-associated NlpC family hydrolase